VSMFEWSQLAACGDRYAYDLSTWSGLMKAHFEKIAVHCLGCSKDGNLHEAVNDGWKFHEPDAAPLCDECFPSCGSKEHFRVICAVCGCAVPYSSERRERWYYETICDHCSNNGVW
jgi:hypothetical protein